MVINDILKGNFDFYRNKPSKFFTARYCGHHSFDIFYFGVVKKTKIAGKVVHDKMVQIKHFDDYKNHGIVSSLVKKRYNCEVVYLKGNFYIFGGYDDRNDTIKEVEMYSHLTKTCKVVANIEDINECDLERYAIYVFMDKIYLIGGYDTVNNEIDLCMEFDTKECSWKHKSRMMETRQDRAACVFEEKIIVSGGLQLADDDFEDFVNHYDGYGRQTSNTVEAYDPIVDTWTKFPTMKYSRCLHKSVVVKNKLFVNCWRN